VLDMNDVFAEEEEACTGRTALAAVQMLGADRSSGRRVRGHEGGRAGTRQQTPELQHS